MINSVTEALSGLGYDWEDADSFSIEVLNPSREDDGKRYVGNKVAQLPIMHGDYGLFGTVLLKDGTWIERVSCGGREWWEHRSTPTSFV